MTDGEVKIDGYSILRNDRNRHGGGVCLYVRNGLNFDLKRIPTPSVECLFIDILFPNTRPITFGVCYRPPSDNSFLTNFQSVCDSLDNSNETYIMGDLNICTRQKSSLSKSYLELLQSYSFKQLIQEPTRITTESSSIIDVLLCFSTIVAFLFALSYGPHWK